MWWEPVGGGGGKESDGGDLMSKYFIHMYENRTMKRDKLCKRRQESKD
jgi:hypothetical protein